MKLERRRAGAVGIMLAALGALALTVPAAAVAQAVGGASSDPTAVQYDDRVPECVAGALELGVGDPGDPGDPACPPDDPARVGGLPFTGLEVGGLALVAAGLLAGGLLLGRLRRGSA